MTAAGSTDVLPRRVWSFARMLASLRPEVQKAAIMEARILNVLTDAEAEALIRELGLVSA